MHAGDGDYVFETLEFAYDERAVGPGTGIRDVEMVATCFGREFTAFLDEAAELTVLHTKSAPLTYRQNGRMIASDFQPCQYLRRNVPSTSLELPALITR